MSRKTRKSRLSGRVPFALAWFLSTISFVSTKEIVRIRSVRKQERKQEHEREDGGDGADVFDFARAQLDDRVRDEARRDAVRDGIGEAHDGDGEEGGNGGCGVFPVDIDHVAHHQYAHVDERARRGALRDERGDGA